MDVKELVRASYTIGGEMGRIREAAIMEARQEAGLLYRPGMSRAEEEKLELAVIDIVGEVYAHPPEGVDELSKELTVITNIARRKLVEAERHLLEDLKGEERLRALIDFYELVPYDDSNVQHRSARILLKHNGVNAVAFESTGTGIFILSGNEVQRFISEHQEEILTLLAKQKNKGGRPKKTGEEVELGAHLVLPTWRGSEHSLSTYSKGGPYLMLMNEAFFQTMEYSRGRFHVRGRPDQAITEMSIGEQDKVNAYGGQTLLMGVYTAYKRHYEACIAKTGQPPTSSNFTLPLSQLAGFMGVDARQRKGGRGLLSQIAGLEQFIAVMTDGSFSRVLTVSSYDHKSGDITLDVPYFLRELTRINREATQVKLKNGVSVSYLLPTHGYLLKSDIVNERNRNAVLIVRRLETLIMQGPQSPWENQDSKAGASEKDTPKKPVMLHISYKELVEQIPELDQVLKGYKGKDARATTTGRNTILERAFSRAYELIADKTDFYEAYINLKINGKGKDYTGKARLVPRYSDLETKALKLTITHEGPNEGYRPEVIAGTL